MASGRTFTEIRSCFNNRTFDVISSSSQNAQHTTLDANHPEIREMLSSVSLSFGVRQEAMNRFLIGSWQTLSRHRGNRRRVHVALMVALALTYWRTTLWPVALEPESLRIVVYLKIFLKEHTGRCLGSFVGPKRSGQIQFRGSSKRLLECIPYCSSISKNARFLNPKTLHN